MSEAHFHPCEVCSVPVECEDECDDEIQTEVWCAQHVEACRVCGSTNHVHCSRGCAICDEPDNPQPRYASRFCAGCKRSLCAQCFEDHACSGVIQ